MGLSPNSGRRWPLAVITSIVHLVERWVSLQIAAAGGLVLSSLSPTSPRGGCNQRSYIVTGLSCPPSSTWWNDGSLSEFPAIHGLMRHYTLNLPVWCGHISYVVCHETILSSIVHRWTNGSLSELLVAHGLELSRRHCAHFSVRVLNCFAVSLNIRCGQGPYIATGLSCLPLPTG